MDDAAFMQEFERRDKFSCIELRAVDIAIRHVLDEVEKVTLLGVGHDEVEVACIMKG